jgi:uncharacterized protein (TIGR02265 family)
MRSVKVGGYWLRSGYALPNFNAPLDVEAARRLVPDHATVKGMYLDANVKRIRAAGAEPVVKGPFIAFKDYPTHFAFELTLQWARLAHPKVPLREALRRVGHSTYDDLRGSLAGRVIFGVLGGDIVAIVKLASKAIAISGQPQRAAVLEVGSHHSLIRVDDIYTFVDSNCVGIFEGVLEACGLEGRVSTKLISASAAEFYTEWK